MKSILLAIAACLSLAGAAKAAPLEVYGRLPQIEDVQLSPDGLKVAVMKSSGETRSIFVFKIDTMTLMRAINAGTEKVRSVTWADNDTLVFTLSEVSKVEVEASENSFGWIYNVATGKQIPLVFNTSEALNMIYSFPEVRIVDGKTYIYVRAQGIQRGGYDDDVLVRSSPDEKRSFVIERGDVQSNFWLIGPDGKVLAETSFDAERARSSITIFGKKRLTVRAPENQLILDAMGLTADGASILVAYGLKNDWESEPRLAEVSLETGAWVESAISNEATSFLFHPRTARLLGYKQLKGDDSIVTYLDPAEAKLWNGLKAGFSGSLVTPVSWSADRSRLVVYVDSPTDGPAYALVDRKIGRADWLGDVYQLTPNDISPVKPISYKAADGLTITGYLTLPKGAEAKNLPLVVLPHGGPASRDEPGFDWWSQALAVRGYAVLRPNFRGSEGFGEAFLTAGFGEWGKKMQTDLSDGVRHLAADGVIDPKRVCIAGASYGGYAALAGATLDRGVYRCAISVAGPSDLGQMLHTEYKSDNRQAIRYWARFMGVKDGLDRRLLAISPVAHAAKVEIPLLLIHGKDDSVVLYDQTTSMAQAMKKAGKPVEVITLDGEDHWLSRGNTRLKMLTGLVAFLEKHNPPNPPVQTARVD